jgi:hypothetical protein
MTAAALGAIVASLGLVLIVAGLAAGERRRS